MRTWTPAEADRRLTMVRSACLRLPETGERPSHAGPGFFIRGNKMFVTFLDDHHDDGRLAIWCAAPEGVQQEMIETEPERFFRPPYVGHRGWLGVHLLTVGQGELDAIAREAYRCVAPKTLIKQLDSDSSTVDDHR
ncbi:MmcQ/YjbR family DNA-binding protein [Microlunatus elymi]|uniref:MmcQ/YjbR family DNA-binding protein n=1 Tax=Microlunatus elymi TaxID=2596828 RepID=A0A516PX75_9ACTN|nr:MmcQ/YjbR family DNA-binding protein [Microlunatus elymi]QDP95780.1 MmcQ/YjbR family DNA-binding protein [Microlunatus elymi]